MPASSNRRIGYDISMKTNTRRAIGIVTVLGGAALALWLKQPGWVFLIVAGIVIYHGGKLPKPHR